MEIPGKSMHIYLQPNTVPNTISIAHLVPLRMQCAANQVISDLLKKQVITKVNKPTPWCALGFFVPKPNGTSVRLVTDYTKLNKFVKRPVHPFPYATEIMQSIPEDANFFAKLDAVHGYFQLALDGESSYLTTFLIPSGKYRYLRAPMGLSSSSDKLCCYSGFAIESCEFAKKIVDNILIWAPSLEQLEKRITQILDRCTTINVTISKKKFAFGTEIPFAGFLISDHGIKPDPQKTVVIASFPSSKNITDLRSFLDLANQLALFLPDFSHLTCEMRKLLSTKNAFLWLDIHETEFHKLKEILTSDLLVKTIDPKLTTILLTDASRLNGLGYALMQKENDTKLRLITCGSCSLSETQNRYATIELECLAIQYAIAKCRFYLLGLPNFEIVTDHKPLLRILKKYIFEVDNPRLQRLWEKMLAFNFTVKWVPGKLHLKA